MIDNEIGKYILANILTIGAVGAFIYFVIQETIKGYIKQHYDKQLDEYKKLISKELEDYKNSIVIKQKAALIAELFAEWNSNPMDKKKLNQLSYEAYLWLPSNIAKDLTKTLTLTPNSPNAKEIMAAVRVHLLGNEEKIDAFDIVHF